MGEDVRIFLFCDALGYDLAQRFGFMNGELPFRYRVETQFGYSSTAVPTILSGVYPEQHGHFGFFFRNPDGGTPFGIFRFLSWICRPRRIFDNHRVRHRLSRWFAKWKKYTGYFNLYRVPLERLPYFDYCEKRDIFAPGGLAPVRNLRDELDASGVPCHISDWRRGDAANLDAAEADLIRGRARFFFIYTAGLDGMLHFHVRDDDFVRARFDEFADRVRRLYAAAKRHYRRVELYLISDHGMTPLSSGVDLRPRLEGVPYRFGRDYLACYDSTMVRVYYLNPACRGALRDALSGAPGHWLSDDEKRRYHVDFADRRYGDDIFLVDPGVQIAPSDMGGRAIPGMHGYAVEDKDSAAALLSNVEVKRPLRTIADFFRLMQDKIAEIRSEEKRS